MRLFRKLLFLVLLLGCSGISFAQDKVFTQSYSAPIYLNPAFTGYTDEVRIVSNYRNAWPALNGQFITHNVSYDQYINKLGGVGLNMMRDKEGDALKTYSVSINYSPMFRLFKEKLSISPAIELGWRRKTLDWSKLVFGNQIDDRFGFAHQQSTELMEPQSDVLDINSGILISHGGFVYGIAVHHLTTPDEGLGSVSLLPRKYTGHILYSLEFENEFRFSPSVIFQRQGDFQMMTLGIMSGFKDVKFGIAYRNGDSFIAMAGYRHKAFALNYSYDVTTSKLNIQNSNGSHELSLTAKFGGKDEKRKGVDFVSF
ncbi:MAG: PorP/SprF family type IX secretion system membrane protein [Flavobacteriales bacterium]|nr:PorP/SprF family type IX secretion system membrane protein [Flavobacteriales bacterium]